MTFLKGSSAKYFRVLQLLILTVLLSSCGNEVDKIATSEVVELTKHVDPFIGTGGHGHVYPGADCPLRNDPTQPR